MFDTLEARRLFALTNGIAVNGDSDIAKSVTAVGSGKLNAGSIRYWSSTSFSSGDNLSSKEISDLKAYSDEGIEVTLLVTLNENPTSTPSYSTVKTWFETQLQNSLVESYVDRWEIINEPNLSKYWPNGNVTTYVNNALKGAWDALHPAGEEVIGAGLADTFTSQTLSDMQSAGYANYVDYFNLHPYSDGSTIATAVSTHKSKVEQFKAVFGTSKPLVSTEWGLQMPTGTDNRNTIDTWEQNWVNALEQIHDYAEQNFETIHYYRLVYNDNGSAGAQGLVYGDTTNYSGHAPFYGAFQGWTSNVTQPQADVTLTPTEDTFVKGADTAAHGSATGLEVKNATTVANDREALIEFDLSQFSGTVESAKLRLNGYLNTADNVTIEVYEADPSQWSEASTIWTNKPSAVGTSKGSLLFSSTSASWKELDLTQLIKDRKGAGVTKVSFLLQASQAATTDAFVTISSREATNKAQLAITLGSQAGDRVASADTYVKGDDTTSTTHGTETQLQVKNAGTVANDRESLLKFSLAGLSATGTYKLRLFGSLNVDDSVWVDVFETSPTAWSDSTNWTSRPSSVNGSLGHATVNSTVGAWYEVDVTTFVRAKIVANATDVSFILRADQGETTDAFASFNSMNATTNKASLRYS